ncbi:DUF1707 SHOCT-like domain-containing protein [Winogradskya consettensis]|nr:DUF1707 domain-containing protein [Actinoplanes consettensis]
MLERMGRDEMRAGDADRQVVADQLRVALDEGRLDLHEYDERLQQTYAAKTYGELSPLLHDLPAAGSVAPVAPVARGASDREVTVRWLTEVWSSWVAVVGITTVIWLVSCVAGGQLNYFWPIWAAGPWGVVLVWVSAMGLATGAPRKEERKRVRKAEQKQLKRERKALQHENKMP